MMYRYICFILCLFVASTTAHAVTSRAVQTRAAAAMANPISGYTYNYMYPYLNNQMRTDLNPGVTTSQSTSPINAIVRTEELSTPRRVVPRSGVRVGATSAARSAAPQPRTQASVSAPAQQARAATTSGPSNRRVVARSGITTTARAATGTRTENSPTDRAAAGANLAPAGATAWTSARCIADYTECMNGYCQREEAQYNRCYCSAKLAQIDAMYQPVIDDLIKQILMAQNTNHWTQAEMNEYWQETIGQYSGTNHWDNLEQALNINWADTASRVRGANAFNTGHEYCVQYLRGCAYMASNLRDVYRSEIARDCATYEQSLQKLKNAAESILEMYSE